MRPARGQFLATVKENAFVCREHFRLTLALPAFPATEPGQFVQILCRDPAEQPARDVEVQWGSGGDVLDPMSMLRRPFSLAGRRDSASGVELDIIHRVVGVGTHWLSELELGDNVSIIGPLGNRFELPAPGVTGLLVAGGVGIPPMLYLAEKLKGRAIAFCGATTRQLLPFTMTSDAQQPSDPVEPALRVVEFARHSVSSVISTDDGSCGFDGYITQALERYLDRGIDPGSCVVYTCGPEPMMKRVAEIAIGRRIECQIAVERAMACGMGTCQSCCIRVKMGDDWRYKLACTDGPVFAADELLW